MVGIERAKPLGTPELEARGVVTVVVAETDTATVGEADTRSGLKA